MKIKLLLLLLIPFYSVVALAQSDPEELITTAQRAFDDGYHDVAIKYLEEFVPENPTHAKIIQAKLLLGQCYYLKNNYLKAIEQLEPLAVVNVNKEIILFWTAETYLKLLNIKKAQSMYEALLKDFGNSVYAPQSLYSLGWSYFDEKNYLKAKSIFDKLILQFPKHQLSEDALLKRAECEFNLGNYSEAISGLTLFMQSYPQSLFIDQVRLNIADGYYYMNDYSHAMEFYEQASKTSVTDSNVIQAANVGKIWSAIKRKMYDLAQKFIKESLEFAKMKSKSTESILLAAGQMFYEKGDMEAAINAYTDLIKNYPSGVYVIEAFLGRANAYYEKKIFTNAKEDFQYVIDHHNVEDQELASKARFGLGWVLVKSGDVTTGVRSFQSVYEQSKDMEVKNNALIQMADAYQEGGRFNDAIGIYEQISKNIQIAGLEDYIQYRLAIALLKAERFEVAQIAFTTLINKYPDSRYLEDVNYYLGVIHFKNNNWGKAANFMDIFLKGLIAPSEFSAQANYILALSYLNQKQSEEALKIFQKILRLYPDEPLIAKNSDMAIAKCLFEMGQVKEAIKRFKLIVFKYPDSEVEQEALLWLAQEAMKSFQYLQAVEYYRELLEKPLDSNRRNQINYELGQAYEVQGALDDALVQYKLVASKDVTLMSKVKLAIAGILSREFDAEKAIGAYLNIAATNTEYAREAFLKAALLYRNAQNYEQEILIYEKALQLDQGRSIVTNVELLFSIADTYELLGNIEKAVDYYLKVPTLYRDQTTWIVKSYLRVAKIYEDRKDWEGAKVTYQKIIQLNVEESRFALDRLELLKKK